MSGEKLGTLFMALVFIGLGFYAIIKKDIPISRETSKKASPISLEFEKNRRVTTQYTGTSAVYVGIVLILIGFVILFAAITA